MRELQSNKPIIHALIWIFIYILFAMIGSNLSMLIGLSTLEFIVLLILSIVLLLYIFKNKWLSYYGINKIKQLNVKRCLYYSPLLIIVGVNINSGLNTSLKFTEVITIMGIMLCVGFLEEIIFRGLLYKAIREKSSAKLAILISAITFGIGHIINLFNGYMVSQQIIQIIIAISIGMLLSIIFEYTNNIIPGVIFHFMFNTAASISNITSFEQRKVELVAIIIISFIYGIYIVKEFSKNIKIVS